MSDRPDPLDKLHEGTEQHIEKNEVNKGVVNNLVSQAEEVIQNEDNHGLTVSEGAWPSVASEPPAHPQIIMDQISIPSEGVSSLDLSVALIRISHLQYNSIDLIGQLKGNISSAMLMKLDEAYTKHWKIQLGGQPFPYLFYQLTGIDSLYIAECSGGFVGGSMEDIEYVCFENIKGNVGGARGSVETAVFKNIDGRANVPAENAVCLSVSDGTSAGDNLILHDVPWTNIPRPRSLKVDNDRPQTAYVGWDPSSENDGRTIILYDAYAGVLVSQNAAVTVRPLTDEEFQLIEGLADGPPPGPEAIRQAISRLREGVNTDE